MIKPAENLVRDLLNNNCVYICCHQRNYAFLPISKLECIELYAQKHGFHHASKLNFCDDLKKKKFVKDQNRILFNMSSHYKDHIIVWWRSQWIPSSGNALISISNTYFDIRIEIISTIELNIVYFKNFINVLSDREIYMS